MSFLIEEPTMKLRFLERKENPHSAIHSKILQQLIKVTNPQENTVAFKWQDIPLEKSQY